VERAAMAGGSCSDCLYCAANVRVGVTAAAAEASRKRRRVGMGGVIVTWSDEQPVELLLIIKSAKRFEVREGQRLEEKVLPRLHRWLPKYR
jgi:hypothetical protein